MIYGRHCLPFLFWVGNMVGTICRDRRPRRSEKKHHINRQLCFTKNKADRRGRRSLQLSKQFTTFRLLRYPKGEPYT